jgi:HAD superfamily hydrolase (TIGR01509 family)
MSSRKIAAVIFDLDGTLADTFKLIVGAWNAAVSPHTGKTYSDEEVISRFGIPDSQMIRRDLAGEAGDAAVETYHAYYEREHAGIVRPFDGVDQMLAELRRREIPLGLMTGKGRRSAAITLKCLGWEKTFTAVVTGEDVARQKPDPDGPLAAARMLRIDPAACAFVGDSPADIGAGKAAKMRTIAAGWHPVYLDEIRKLKPDAWAETPMDVVRAISQ